MMDWEDPDAPWNAKLRRAARHITEVAERCRDYEALSPWRVQSAPGLTPNEVGYVLRVDVPVPSDLVAGVGDVIHNLRSSLDSLAFALAGRSLGRVMTEAEELSIAFPICVQDSEFDSFFTGRRAGIFGDVERLAFRGVQPFHIPSGACVAREEVFANARGHHLYRLRRLSNIDKHRRLPIVTWFPRDTYWVNPGNLPELRYRQVLQGEYGDGDVIAYLSAPPEDAIPELAITHTMHLALADDPVYRTELVATLWQWLGHIRDAVVPGVVRVAEGGKPLVL